MSINRNAHFENIGCLFCYWNTHSRLSCYWNTHSHPYMIRAGSEIIKLISVILHFCTNIHYGKISICSRNAITLTFYSNSLLTSALNKLSALIWSAIKLPFQPELQHSKSDISLCFHTIQTIHSILRVLLGNCFSRSVTSVHCTSMLTLTERPNLMLSISQFNLFPLSLFCQIVNKLCNIFPRLSNQTRRN